MTTTARTSSPAFAIGQPVGILSGVQSVAGPHVHQHGTVVRYFEGWGSHVEYVVLADDGTELVYPAYLLLTTTH